jgi:inosine-uridine nucleoside N-ribohydrolase
MKIHLDTDIGGDIDDVNALAMLLKMTDVEIVGITTVAEENGRRAGYAKYVLSLVNQEHIKLKSGADVADGYYKYKPGYPSEEEMWPVKINPFPSPKDEAIELLKQSIASGATIVAIGPYTNLALVEKKYPGTLMNARLFLMGGYIYPPRDGYVLWTNDMDYNIQLDILSAKFVLENSNPTLIPLPISLETFICHSDIPELKKGDELSQLMARQADVHDKTWNNAENIGKKNSKTPDDIINFLYDPLACAIAVGWDKCEINEVRLSFNIKDGLLYEEINSTGKNVKVVTHIDGESFNKFWLTTVTR